MAINLSTCSFCPERNKITISYDRNWKNLWKKRFSDPLVDAETFKIDRNKKILEIGKKTNKYIDIQGQYMGLIKFNPKGWGVFKKFLTNRAIRPESFTAKTSFF